MELARLAGALSGARETGGVRVPKYQLLSDGIMQAIESGELQPGDRLPGESEMAERLPFSLGTVQKALSHLAERGAVIRRHGTGTFVAEPPSQLNDLWHFRFLADDGKALLPVYTRVTKIGRATTGGPWTEFLGDESHHVRIDRQIDVNHEFTAVARMYLSGTRFSDLLSASPATMDNINMRALLRERFDAPTLRIVEQVGAETLPADIARLLDLTETAGGLVLHIQGYGFRDAPLSYQVVYIPPDTRRLELQPKHP
ncbi:MAG: GntR family transcriptional regulator [Magnetovibrio sp.]|nr:GntR family transcriptional regulator [Magnetovibrio sp.]